MTLEDGFEFTLVMAASKPYEAKLTFDDTNNEQSPSTASISPVYAVHSGDDCVIDIKTFSLDNITPHKSGRWEFEFTL